MYIFSFNSSIQRSTLLFKSGGILGHPKICGSPDFILSTEPYFHSLEFVVLKKKKKKKNTLHESSKTFDEHALLVAGIQF